MTQKRIILLPPEKKHFKIFSRVFLGRKIVWENKDKNPAYVEIGQLINSNILIRILVIISIVILIILPFILILVIFIIALPFNKSKANDIGVSFKNLVDNLFNKLFLST
jgi:hypothetical protein